MNYDYIKEVYFKNLEKLKPLDKEFYTELYNNIIGFHDAIDERMKIIVPLLKECMELSEKTGIPFEFPELNIVSQYLPQKTSLYFIKSNFDKELSNALIDLFGDCYFEHGSYNCRIGWQPSQLGC